MTAEPALPCANCGYDLRATPAEGVCPECETPVTEALKIAALPLRPMWRDSDPRWRRRILTGLWALLLILPLPDAIEELSTVAWLNSPVLYDLWSDWFGERYVRMTYGFIVVSIGLVLLFSRERNVRPRRMTMIRRIGVAGSYLTFLAGICGILTVTLLVASGIERFLSDGASDRIRPMATFVHRWPDWLYYAYPFIGLAVTVLAGIVLLDAIRRTSMKWMGWPLLIAGVLCVAIQSIGLILGLLESDFTIGAADWEPFIQPSGLPAAFSYIAGVCPADAAHYYRGYPAWLADAVFEIVKWLLVLTIAMVLTLAQIASWRASQRDKRHEESFA